MTTTMKAIRRERLLNALRAAGPDTWTSTSELARACGLDNRTALKLLDTLQADGLACSTYSYAGRQTVRVWSIVKDAWS